MAAWQAHKRGREGKGREGEGAQLGVRLGEEEGCRGSAMGARPSMLLCRCSLFACCCCCSREKKQEGGRREEKREKRKEERKEKIKREIFSNLEISKK
jgi:hypothetical protein